MVTPRLTYFFRTLMHFHLNFTNTFEICRSYLKCSHCAPSRMRPDAPMQERVDEEKMSEIDRKPTRDTNNNGEEGTQDMCGIADADIPSVEVPDGNCLGEKDDPPQHKPTSQILHDGSGPTAISRLGDLREEHETPPTAGDVEMTCRPIPDISRRQHVSTLEKVEHVSGCGKQMVKKWRTVPRSLSTDETTGCCWAG